jgi:hypothetical protein
LWLSVLDMLVRDGWGATNDFGKGPSAAAIRGCCRRVVLRVPALWLACLMMGVIGFFVAACVAMNPL